MDNELIEFLNFLYSQGKRDVPNYTKDLDLMMGDSPAKGSVEEGEKGGVFSSSRYGSSSTTTLDLTTQEEEEEEDEEEGETGLGGGEKLDRLPSATASRWAEETDGDDEEEEEEDVEVEDKFHCRLRYQHSRIEVCRFPFHSLYFSQRPVI
jgi:hypothetical protein